MKRPDEVIKILREKDGELRTDRDKDDIVAYILHLESRLSEAEKVITQLEAVWSGMETVKRIIANYRSRSQEKT